MPIQNPTMAAHAFLAEMHRDAYFPKDLVQQGEQILRTLCLQIEQTKPSSLTELYALTHAATEAFNDLQTAFEERDSEIETAARDCIGMDFEHIATAYGFADADVEELIAPREW